MERAYLWSSKVLPLTMQLPNTSNKDWERDRLETALASLQVDLNPEEDEEGKNFLTLEPADSSKVMLDSKHCDVFARQQKPGLS